VMDQTAINDLIAFIGEQVAKRYRLPDEDVSVFVKHLFAVKGIAASPNARRVSQAYRAIDADHGSDPFVL
jgi:hypothetical protein